MCGIASIPLLIAMTAEPSLLVHLPEDVFYKILCFVNHPYFASVVVTRQINPLCSATRQYTSSDSLWENILGGYYLHHGSDSSSTSHMNNKSSRSQNAYRARTQRRSSKRLRRTTAKEDCIHAHFNLRDQTEMCLQEVADMAISKTPHPLSLARLRGVLNNYGPMLNIDQRSAIGGTFLVDCCKARCIKEGTILACIKELIEKYGASAAVPATEGSSYQRITKKHNTLPALVVASARGMVKVVQYLIEKDPYMVETAGSGRFRLMKNPKKSISGTYTPLQFATKMRDAELDHGATKAELNSINQCIRILTAATER